MFPRTSDRVGLAVAGLILESKTPIQISDAESKVSYMLRKILSSGITRVFLKYSKNCRAKASPFNYMFPDHAFWNNALIICASLSANCKRT